MLPAFPGVTTGSWPHTTD